MFVVEDMRDQSKYVTDAPRLWLWRSNNIWAGQCSESHTLFSLTVPFCDSSPLWNLYIIYWGHAAIIVLEIFLYSFFFCNTIFRDIFCNTYGWFDLCGLGVFLVETVKKVGHESGSFFTPNAEREREAPTRRAICCLCTWCDWCYVTWFANPPSAQLLFVLYNTDKGEFS